MKLEVGKFYRTVNGSKVKITKINGYGNYPIKGDFYDRDGTVLHNLNFTRNGEYIIDFNSVLNIVPPEYIEPTAVEDKLGKFSVGDRVNKPKGYKFPGTVVSVFETTKGEIRYVVELFDLGLLHIFNEQQLELLE